MLKTILSVSGKPGLFRLVSNGKNMVIVESLTDKRRLPIHARDKVVSLGDIAMYTATDEVPLADVLFTIQTKENGGKTWIGSGAKPEELKAYFAEILPDYDRDRVYDSDIKKLLAWYNILIDFGFKFAKEDAENSEAQETETPEAEVKEAAKPAKEEKEATPKKKPRAKKE
ncbi:MAG: hypothetical protein RL662_2466 [Bacteroidota bacterium]|jgi:pyruvate/2-oxoglutarate dehydrogenase complex dihydrolipoamide acyltransferase (E2) component